MHPGGLLGLRLALRAVAKATLSSLVLAINSQTLKQQHRCYPGEYGASGRIRTSDRSVRSRVLYPAELRMHRDLLLYCSIFISLRKQYEVIDGASGRIRTSDRSVRSRVLYPAELRMHRDLLLLLLILGIASKATQSKIWCIREDSNLRPLGS